MNENGTQLIFAELLSRHGRIRVPLIQRDYAQGRSDQEEVREEFLAALYHALSLPPDSEALPLNLDFIYGSVEGQAPNCFQPLDGQQRLTTLFLLHWYLAWRDGCGEAFRALCADGAISRFSYQVRPSSSEFFDALVCFAPSCFPGETSKVSTLIADQPWYFLNWRLDPTIQSSLVMLDAIHTRFRDEQGLFARLTDTYRPAITFQLLDLRDFGLSDDLYIKMNARGKPLTPFETFKARYEQTLNALFGDETRILDGQPVTVADFFSRRMDTRWADFFWPHRDPDSHVFDMAVMNVFRAVILITRSPQSDGFVEDITLLRSRARKNSYAFFHQRDWLDISFSEMFMTLLEAWSAAGSDLVRELPDRRYFDEEAVFGKLLSDPTSLGYEEIVQLAAYAQFLKAHAGLRDPSVFQEWMRVVYNLSVNTEYNRPADLQRSLVSLAELAPQMTSMLEYLAQTESEIGGFSQQQVAEEQLKARLLLADSGWHPLMDQAEVHGYFRGQVGFLLRFCGASTHPAANGEGGWESAATLDLQAKFSDYLQKAAAMFERIGLINLPQCRWERALLAVGDYLLPARRNHSFLVNSQADQDSWKRLLRGASSASPQGEVLRQVWERLSGTAALEAQLDAIIADAFGLEAWRAALVATPNAITYCGQRMMRRDENGSIYLLRKSQMNGAHSELFTYCLYKNFLEPMHKAGRLQKLMPYYQDTYTMDEEPGVRLRGNYQDQTLLFYLTFEANQYLIFLPATETLTEAISEVLAEIGLIQTDELQELRLKDGVGFRKRCPMGDIERVIFELDRRLATTGERSS